MLSTLLQEATTNRLNLASEMKRLLSLHSALTGSETGDLVRVDARKREQTTRVAPQVSGVPHCCRGASLLWNHYV